ncbi:ABC transporter permease [Herbaspirillum sp. alder98]|uniref:ABC transporter permease n=1 Tax=Herbaspirillum sp. alder98 TaxID=2913096 RepID=UPI001CD8B984|nr:ABC transporter permease [Herbaspirillum sp. alder98]MCA1323217.1 ABC transporter permease [Herbaspirillum sp. alder98]
MNEIKTPAAQPATEVLLAPPETPGRLLLKRFLRNRTGTVALALLLVLIVMALSAPLISPQNPYDLAQVSIMEAERAPGAHSDDHRLLYLLGTDGAGRDMFSAILYGLRISLGIGVVSALAALAVGTTVGLIAAYFGGRVDAFLMRVVDVQLSIPTILVALVLLAVLGQGLDKTLMALVLVQWAIFARNVRGAAIVERGKDYIEAAMGQGLSPLRIMFRHVLPNCMAPLIVTATNQMANAISLEATISFLGIGLPQTEPSLGLLISNGFDYILSNEYWISMFPGVALVLLVISISVVGDQLRVVLNPKLDG